MIVLVTGGFDHKLRFWEASSGVCSRALRCPGDGQINCLAVSSDKQLLVAGGNPHISLFDVNSNSDAPLVSFDGHTSNVTAVGFQRDGKWLYSGSEDGTVRIWDPRSSVSQRCFETSPLSPVHTVALHPNQTDLLAGDQAGPVRVWDLEANACRHKHALGEQPVRSLSIACDASIVAVGSHKGRVTILESTDNRTLSYKTHFQAHDEYLLRCVLSPDTRTLATASADKVRALLQTQYARASNRVRRR